MITSAERKTAQASERPAIFLGVDTLMFLGRIPHRIPPTDALVEEEWALDQKITLDGREVTYYCGFGKIKAAPDSDWIPYVALKFNQWQPADKDLRVIIKIAGVEFSASSEPESGYSFRHVAKGHPVFATWKNKSNRNLTFHSPIKTDELVKSMSVRFERKALIAA